MIETGVSAGMVRLRGGDSDPRFGASNVRIQVPLRGMRPLPLPTVEVTGGLRRAAARAGPDRHPGHHPPGARRQRPGDSAPQPLVVALQGSYGGARESLWRATGEVEGAAATGRGAELAINVRAARFSLDRIRDILPPSILQPADTKVDAALDLRYADGKLGFSGNLDVSGLSLEHEAVSSSPVRGLNLALAPRRHPRSRAAPAGAGPVRGADAGAHRHAVGRGGADAGKVQVHRRHRDADGAQD